MLKTLEKKAYAWFGGFTQEHISESLKLAMESAHITMKADAYMATSLLYSFISLLATCIFFVVLYFTFFPLFDITLVPFHWLLFTVMPVAMFGLTYAVFLQIPASKAKSRGKKIDLNLPYALNFVSAMAAAGVTPTDIFKSLSKQQIYGAVQDEASWIYRDVAFLGKDIISAIRDNMKRTPSEKFKDFLQGLVVTVTSGGSLKTYFVAKANQFTVENRQRQKQTIESLGIMAESYVTAAVAGILLLFIVIPLMMIISGDTNQINFLYVIVFLIVPMIHIAFAYVVYSMALEG
jgi:archaeal flagellar protein FlaJ